VQPLAGVTAAKMTAVQRPSAARCIVKSFCDIIGSGKRLKGELRRQLSANCGSSRRQQLAAKRYQAAHSSSSRVADNAVMTAMTDLKRAPAGGISGSEPRNGCNRSGALGSSGWRKINQLQHGYSNPQRQPIISERWRCTAKEEKI